MKSCSIKSALTVHFPVKLVVHCNLNMIRPVGRGSADAASANVGRPGSRHAPPMSAFVRKPALSPKYRLHFALAVSGMTAHLASTNCKGHLFYLKTGWMQEHRDSEAGGERPMRSQTSPRQPDSCLWCRRSANLRCLRSGERGAELKQSSAGLVDPAHTDVSGGLSSSQQSCVDLMSAGSVEPARQTSTDVSNRPQAVPTGPRNAVDVARSIRARAMMKLSSSWLGLASAFGDLPLFAQTRKFTLNDSEAISAAVQISVTPGLVDGTRMRLGQLPPPAIDISLSLNFDRGDDWKIPQFLAISYGVRRAQCFASHNLKFFQLPDGNNVRPPVHFRKEDNPSALVLVVALTLNVIYLLPGAAQEKMWRLDTLNSLYERFIGCRSWPEDAYEMGIAVGVKMQSTDAGGGDASLKA
ncbi:hypothetical protein FB451DRAFT_1180640 [Mycena latifolia]|nr:hypothetical protein FB451DRAFT_1180640 [Mycena latifolia]